MGTNFAGFETYSLVYENNVFSRIGDIRLHSTFIFRSKWVSISHWFSFRYWVLQKTRWLNQSLYSTMHVCFNHVLFTMQISKKYIQGYILLHFSTVTCS